MLSLKKAGVSGIEDHMRPKSVLKLTGLSGARVPMGEKKLLIQLGPLSLSASTAQLGKSQAPNSKAGSSLV